MTDEQTTNPEDLDEDNTDADLDGKSLDELVGEGQIANATTVHSWLEKYQGSSVKDLLENTPVGITAHYDERSKILIISDSLSLPTEADIMKPVDFKEGIFGMRGDIELVKSKVKNWVNHPELNKPMISMSSLLQKDHEMLDNLILSYRHLEDARMRLGKAVQAFDGGKSCYPR